MLHRDVLFLATGLVVIWATLGVGIDWERLVRLPSRLADISSRMLLPPDWSFLGLAVDEMIITIAMAWLGTLMGAVLSLPMGFLGARNVTGGTISTVARLVLDAIRAVPELVLALVVFLPVVGLSPVAGVLAIGVHSIGTLGKLSAEAIESIDPGPVEAGRAVGAGRIAQQRWGVLPQVLPEIVAFWLYRFEINLRAAAVMGLIGAGGVGVLLLQTLTYRRWDKAGMTVLVIIVATILVDQASGWLRRRIIEGADVPPAREADVIADPALLGR
jgi:phosphonate transport system permease protein